VPQMFMSLGHRLGQGGADLLFDAANRSQGDGHVQGGGQKFFRLPFAEVIATGAQADGDC